MKILAIIPVWKRPDILEICVDGLKHIPVEPLFVLSKEDRYLPEIEKILKDHWTCFETNWPVGRKLNSGINLALKEFKFDYLMNMGSDDIISPELFDIYQPYFDKKEKLFGVNNLYIMNYINKEVMFVENYNIERPIGAGRMIHRSVLTTMKRRKYQIYENTCSHGMDTNSQLRITQYAQIEAKVINTGRDPLILDIKTATNINPYPQMVRLSDKIEDSKEIIDYFSKYTDKLWRKYRKTR
jgi:hypothetical protein